LIRVVVFLLVLVGAVAAYFAIVLNWNFSSGERAGWVQKFSNKGWICKTWEGEMAMVTMPGAVPEKFLFTVRDDAVAAQINKVMGKRVTLHYDEKVGLPTSCWGETRHFVTGVMLVEDIPLVPGIIMQQNTQPTAPPSPASPTSPTAPAQPAPASPAQPTPAK
jgi:hypothetical protein